MPWDAEEAMSLLKRRDEYSFIEPARGEEFLKKCHRYKTRKNNYDPRKDYNSLKWKEIVVARERAEGAVTAYINSSSVTGNPLFEGDIEGVLISKRYPIGHSGVNDEPGIASSVAKLESLNPLKNEVLRLEVEGPSAFRTLLDWYSGLRDYPHSPAVVTSAPLPILIEATVPEPSTPQELRNSGSEGDSNGTASNSETEDDAALQMADPEKRKVVENYAVKLAKDFYLGQEFNVQEFGKPFDLLCTKEGIELHVEVKGTTGSGRKVTLTRNEVKDAQDPAWRSDLFVVHNIVLSRILDQWVADGGITLRLEGWVPKEEDLEVTVFEYTVPR
jgi:hypothetical protein